MSWSSPQPSEFEEDELHDLKLQLAAIVARNPTAAHSAPYELFPGEENRGRAFQAQSWLHEKTVIEEVKRIVASGNVDSSDILPNKHQFAHELLVEARSAFVAKDRLDAYKAFGETMGYISKGGVNINNNIDNRVVKVLRLPPNKDPETFAREFKAQQTQLIKDARASRPN
jgi:hypothetical protein